MNTYVMAQVIYEAVRISVMANIIICVAVITFAQSGIPDKVYNKVATFLVNRRRKRG